MLVNGVYLLEQFKGKGGWTYIALPEVPPDKYAHFGWIKVKGSIDNHPLHSSRLMPLGNGVLFLPVKAAIRKQIGKRQGDTVQLVLERDNEPLAIPEELILCLQDYPEEHAIFLSYPEGAQKAFIEWIYAAKTESTKANRIASMLNKLLLRQKLGDQ
ncbi:YdeI/OmpD-associated family protein [Pseudocnuella soli]|uniref:YdeI/OmpD-associated family protein n=1 Tax=Pseudocnuella soli TaxID=2502779 RepID=UPI0010526E09|nr:YdeI/OmpD-associated family protein [Pseudocnuella soli]